MTAHTPSDLMIESQIPQEPACVLPHSDVQKFLLDVLAQASFPGSMSEFVSGVKALIKGAKVTTQ
jgi:hypothetical protein